MLKEIGFLTPHPTRIWVGDEKSRMVVTASQSQVMAVKVDGCRSDTLKDERSKYAITD
jgi:hypothetical protein